MNTYIRIFVLISILFNYSNSFAYDCEVDGIYYNRLSSNEVEVTHNREYNDWGYGGKCYQGDIIIPKEISYAGKKFSVTQIGKFAFRSCEYMKSISLPKTIKRIEEHAFEGCKFTSFTVPQSLVYCGESAFNMITLESIYINSIEQWLCIEDDGHTGKSLPHGKDYYVNEKIINELIIPKGTKEIPNRRFEDWSNIKSVKIPDGVTYIGFWAFLGCINLEKIEIPNSVKEIGEMAFGSSKIKTIKLPNQLKKLECLGSCKNLVDITIPENVSTIGHHAFYDCISLKAIKIPKNVNSIENCAFNRCQNLTDIYLCSENPPTINNNTFDQSHYTWANLYVPYNCASKYKNDKVWKLFYDIKEFNSTHIDNINNKDIVTHIYTIEGVKKDNKGKGINIIRNENGIIRKVLHK